MRATLVILARVPRWGHGKRRLAAQAGERIAWRFQRDNLSASLRRLARDPRWQTRLAVTPDRALPAAIPTSLRSLRAAIELEPQGDGDLGMRMARAILSPPPGPVVLMGADIPGVRRTHVVKAFRALGSHDWVIGPAGDGGYWLIGARRRPCLRLPFRGVRWGTRHALADTCARIDGSVALIDQLDDVDEQADLALWRPGRL